MCVKLYHFSQNKQLLELCFIFLGQTRQVKGGKLCKSVVIVICIYIEHIFGYMGFRKVTEKVAFEIAKIISIVWGTGDK